MNIQEMLNAYDNDRKEKAMKEDCKCLKCKKEYCKGCFVYIKNYYRIKRAKKISRRGLIRECMKSK